ncbi:MAG: ArsR/SmtB family transcription factor [Bacteroidales bacterium]
MKAYKIFIIQIIIVILRFRNNNMGSSKSEEFTIKDNRIARYAKALAHPARVSILKLLIKKQTCMCGTIVEELPLSQSTVSQHLKELKEAGLIRGEIEGPRICYCIDEEEWRQAQKYFNDFFNLNI